LDQDQWCVRIATTAFGDGYPGQRLVDDLGYGSCLVGSAWARIDQREAGRALIQEGERYEPRRKTYIYVNNRLEGNALETIAAMLALAGPR